MSTPTDPEPGTGEPDEALAALSYEEARQQLVEIVGELEAGAPLEKSLALWERGERLAALCRSRLEHARERIDRRTEGSPDT